MIADPHWEPEGGARWWVFERTLRAKDWPHVYQREQGVVWRWNPAQAGTGLWVIEVMQSLEGAGWIGRALRRHCPALAAQEAMQRRSRSLRFERTLHAEIARVVVAIVRGPSFDNVAREVIFAAERVALERGDAWPLHLALAADRLRASLEAHGR